MAAHFNISSTAQVVPFEDAAAFPLPTSTPRRRPSHLRVLEGGRSTRHMAKVYRQRRFVAALFLAAVVIAMTIVVSHALSLMDTGTAVTHPPANIAASTGPVVVVQQGDTLSSIARRIQPSGSITSLVDRLAAAHGPGPLLAGDRLPLPR